MKRGDVVYFILRGLVRKGYVSKKEGNEVSVFYEKNNKKYYVLKKNQLATEIEGGQNGVERLSKRSSSESDTGCDKQSGKLHVSGVSIGNRTGKRKKVFKGAWQVCNMA